MIELDSRFPELPWYEAVERILPVVFRIYAGKYVGTAFAIGAGQQQSPTGTHGALLITALHVLEDVLQPESLQPTRLIELVSADRMRRFSSAEDEIHLVPIGEKTHDTALIFVDSSREEIVSQGELRPVLTPEGHMLRGAEVGWVGFPGRFEPEPCFFHGHVSGYWGVPATYLIDGVAMGGVSGGPAFDNRACIFGFVSTYIPSRVDKYTSLPGVLALVPVHNMVVEALKLGVTAVGPPTSTAPDLTEG